MTGRVTGMFVALAGSACRTGLRYCTAFPRPIRLPTRPTSFVAMRMESTIYPTLENKSLVSIQDCLDAYNKMKDKTKSDIVFVDGSWYHRSKRSGRAEFEEGPRIKGSRYMDMDDIAARGDLFPDLNPKNLPHMLPPKELFAAAMDSMGIKNSDHIVVYGKEGCVFTPRTWFLLMQMGHANTHLMQGSFEEWADAGGAVESQPTTVIRADDLDLSKQATYQARDAPNVVNMEQMLRAVEQQRTGSVDDTIVIDPRGTTFAAGHMPGAVHIPYRDIVTEDNMLKFKPRTELLEIFNEAGVDVNTEKKIIATCGSGVSVCHIVLALKECGRDISKNTYIYDGSWTEWGAEDSTPKFLLCRL